MLLFLLFIFLFFFTLILFGLYFHNYDVFYSDCQCVKSHLTILKMHTLGNNPRILGRRIRFCKKTV